MNDFSFLREYFLGNKVESWFWFAGILLFGILLKRWISGRVTRLIYHLFKRYCKAGGLQKFILLLTAPIELFFTILIVYLAFDKLEYPTEWNLVPDQEFGFRMVILRLLQVAFLISMFWIVLRLVDFVAVIMTERAKKTESLADDQLVSFAKEAVKVVIAIIGLFIILGIAFRLDVVSLIAGLGIGGLAIALAAKETLENLLGSFTIFLDKPFVTGDHVRVGKTEGKVEGVGFRSTRIRALDKMLVTVPNKKMIEAEVINETNRLFRRSSFFITLGFETNEEQLKGILNDIKKILADHSLIENGSETVRFRNIGNNGLEIQIVFVVLSPEMSEFLIVQEEINFQILRIVKMHDSSLSIPSFLKEETDFHQSGGFNALSKSTQDD